MSGCQYYEFRAIDRLLTPKEMRELRAVSTRAELLRRYRAANPSPRRDRSEARTVAELLAASEESAWREVDELIAARKPVAYDEAVQLLSDLWQLGRREGRTGAVEERIRALRAEHARKANFLDRLDRAGLPGSGRGHRPVVHLRPRERSGAVP